MYFISNIIIPDPPGDYALYTPCDDDPRVGVDALLPIVYDWDELLDVDDEFVTDERPIK